MRPRPSVTSSAADSEVFDAGRDSLALEVVGMEVIMILWRPGAADQFDADVRGRYHRMSGPLVLPLPRHGVTV